MNQTGPHLKVYGTTQSATALHCINCLERAFGNPDPKETVCAALKKLRLGNDDFATYNAKFKRYRVEIDYNNDAILNCFVLNLSNEMQDCLIYVDLSSTLDVHIAQY